MRLFNCTVLGLMATAATATTAQAGGLGIDFIGGTHTEKVQFFDGSGSNFMEMQQSPTLGFGIQAVLGDRDDDLIGIMKFGYVLDSPASSSVSTDIDGWGGGDPTQVTGMFPCDDDKVLAEWKNQGMCGARGIGTISAGLQWRVWGDPSGFQVSLIPSVGAGIVTADSTEFLQVQFGPGMHYAVTKSMQVHADVVYQARFRKSLTHGASLTTGVRWLFD